MVIFKILALRLILIVFMHVRKLFSYAIQHCIERHQARLFNYEGIFLVRLVANGVVREFLLTTVSPQAQPT